MDLRDDENTQTAFSFDERQHQLQAEHYAVLVNRVFLKKSRSAKPRKYRHILLRMVRDRFWAKTQRLPAADH